MFEECQFKLSLGSDNHSGVHPEIMAAVLSANRGHAHAYGLDEVSALADVEFKRAFGHDVDVHYVFNGTAANVLGLTPLLDRFGAVICASSSHLENDEGGAPEKFLNAKLWTMPSADGKIYPQDVDEILQRRGDQHYAQPQAISLSLPTELGVVYTLDELRAWREFARARSLMLHVDGARLSNAAAHHDCNFKDLLDYLKPDSVAFGGTKNGLLGAEAVLLFSDHAKRHFKFHRKQAMQLPSKTRFLAAQFQAYLKEGLWKKIATHTLNEAKYLERQLQQFPEIKIAHPVQSNAIFVNLPKAWIKPLKSQFFFYIWDQKQNQARWMLSWDWQRNNTNALLQSLNQLQNERL